MLISKRFSLYFLFLLYFELFYCLTHLNLSLTNNFLDLDNYQKNLPGFLTIVIVEKKSCGRNIVKRNIWLPPRR